MKNLTKLFTTLFGIIALSAVMVCVFIACDANDPGDDDDKNKKNTQVIPAEYQNTIWRHYIDELQEDYSVKKVLDGYKLYLLKDKVTVNKDGKDLKTYPFAKTEPVDGGKVLQFDTKNEVAGLITFKNNVVINAIFPDMGSKTGGWKEFVRYEDVVIDGIRYSFEGGHNNGNYYNEFEKDDLQYAFCVVIRDGIKKIKKDLIILPKVRDIPVREIGSQAFQDSELISVTIPNSITYIGYNAFYGNQLTSVTIPNSVTWIDVQAFYGNQLTSVIIPNSVTTIEHGAFNNNQLTSVTIGNSVKEIENYAFANNQLTSVTIPNSVKQIYDTTFASNPITSVTIGSNVAIANNESDKTDGFWYFSHCYYENKKAAGTYTRPTPDSTEWTKQ